MQSAAGVGPMMTAIHHWLEGVVLNRQNERIHVPQIYWPGSASDLVFVYILMQRKNKPANKTSNWHNQKPNMYFLFGLMVIDPYKM